MSETNTTTDANLLALIQTSGLVDEQKKDLSGLVSLMTAEERQELLQLIDDSKKFTGERDKQYVELNKEYTQKLKDTTKNESEYVRKEFEKFDTKMTSGEFAVMESEIQKSDFVGAVKSERVKVGNAQKHGLRNAVLFLLFLVILASAIVYGLNYLNAL